MCAQLRIFNTHERHKQVERRANLSERLVQRVAKLVQRETLECDKGDLFVSKDKKENKCNVV